MKQITIFGTGYVGLVAGACLADLGYDVMCVDIDKKKINALNNGEISIYEPGLEGMVKKNVKKNRLHFTTDAEEGVAYGKIIYIAVGTPPIPDSRAPDLKYVKAVAETIGRHMSEYKIVINKSTVPVGTGELVESIISQHYDGEFDVVSNPEFLKEGAAINDFMKPDRIVIGTESARAKKEMIDLYKPLRRPRKPILVMDRKSAEMTKYAANSMLATRISFMNEISRLCEASGANILSVKQGIGYDTRIGPRFLHPGIGYGGSCFPKDVDALIESGEQYGQDLTILKAVQDVNKLQKTILVSRIEDELEGLDSKKIAVWGLSFKPKTDDIRESASIDMIAELLARGATIAVYDPEAMENTKESFPQIEYGDDQYSILKDADALVLATEWDEFRSPDYDRFVREMNNPCIFDGRDIYVESRDKMGQRNIKYFGIGIPDDDDGFCEMEDQGE